MENASKALLIAGSILVVILLIAMGVRVFNSTSGTTDSVEQTMSSTEVAMFNSRFMPYIGSNKTVNEAKALINLIIANNSTNTKKIGVRYIYKADSNKSVNTTTDIMSLNLILQRISSSETSNITRIIVSTGWGTSTWNSGYDSEGYISNIYIEDDR